MEQEIAKKNKSPLRLFLDFAKIGCFTFGGGWSIIAQMQKKYIEEEGIITSEELLDITSVGRSLPGIMIGNVTFLFGYHVAGILGAWACLIGVALAPFTILSLVTLGYSMVAGNPYVAKAMMGVRAAVVPIIATAAMKLFKGAFKYKITYLFLPIAIIMYVVFDISCIWIVLLGAVLGLVLSGIYEGRKTEC